MKLNSSIDCCTTFVRLMVQSIFPNITKIVSTLFCCALLIAVTAPARADVCSDAFPGNPCGVTITVSGASGSLTATINVVGGPYDTLEDQLVGITNTSLTATVGAIVLSGPAVAEPIFAFDFDGPCVILGGSGCGTPTGYEGPKNTFVGISTDQTTGKVLFTTPLAPGQSTWFALENTPATVVAVGENKALTAGSPTTFTFGSSGVDDYVITPLNSASGDNMTITPYQVPQASFSATNFSGLDCVPYKDFNSGSPVCIEIERDCFGTDSCNFVYTAQLDFKIDSAGIPNPAGIGGPRFLGLPGAACPTSGFNQDILLTYIGAIVDPLKGGGSGGGSCWVAAFDPTAAPVTTNSAVSTFAGFTGLLAPPNLNLVNPGSSEPLNFTYFTSSGSPVTNLHWCQTLFTQQGNCTGTPTPWVAFGTVPISCTTEVPTATPPVAVAGNSNLQNLGGGSYRFNWKTSKTAPLGTCVTVVAQFNTGLAVFPDNFKFAKQ